MDYSQSNKHIIFEEIEISNMNSSSEDLINMNSSSKDLTNMKSSSEDLTTSTEESTNVLNKTTDLSVSISFLNETFLQE